MEGKGYWIFLLIMYGLSALMKRRQQAAARRKILEEDQSFSEEPKENKPEPRDIFRELFEGAWLEEEQDTEPVVVPTSSPPWQQEDASEDVIADQKTEEIPEPNPEQERSIVNTQVETILTENVTKVPSSRKVDTALLYQLKNTSALKNSILVREILDKPRSLRRRIR
ncbi:MAG: hypothetical protein ACE5D8_03460 [Fidelibacterota bacterium]